MSRMLMAPECKTRKATGTPNPGDNQLVGTILGANRKENRTIDEQNEVDDDETSNTNKRKLDGIDEAGPVQAKAQDSPPNMGVSSRRFLTSNILIYFFFLPIITTVIF